MITDSKIASLKPGMWLSDPAPKGAGRLQIRLTSAGAAVFYFRYTLPSGKRDTLPLGNYDAKAKAGLSLREARQKAGELSRLYQSGVKNIREHFAMRDKAEVEARANAIVATRQSDDDTTRTSLKALVNGYVESLEIAGKLTTKQIRYTLNHYVIDPYPELAERKASSIMTIEFRSILAAMLKRNIGRQTATVRSYLHAAYQVALRAENDPKAPTSLLGFGIEYNPIAAIPALSEFNGVGERALSEKEFGAYVRELRNMPASLPRSVLLLAVFLGGQRLQQLLRVKTDDVDLDGQTIRDKKGARRVIKTVMLRDPKGNRKRPRLHVLPIVGDAEELFDELLARRDEVSLLFSSDGKTPFCTRLITGEVSAISKRLQAARVARSPFTFGDMRRTCETLMAAIAIHKDIRAQVQSHGLGGVQMRHYDKYEYLIEKFDALQKWAKAIAEFESRATEE